MEIRRVLTIPDLHYPFNIHLGPLYKFASVFKPTHILYEGDGWNLELIGHWNHQEIMREKGLEYIRNELDKESKGLCGVIRRFSSVSGCKNTIYMEGNHEAWIKQYQASYGNISKPLSLTSFLANAGVTEFVDQGKMIKIGHLGYLHGENYNGGNILNICKRVVDDYEIPVVFAHFHAVAEAPKSSVLRPQEKKFGKCIGAMCHLNPTYLKNKPNQWQNAFHIAYVKPDSTFNDYTVRITGKDGAFTGPDGKWYSD